MLVLVVLQQENGIKNLRLMLSAVRMVLVHAVHSSKSLELKKRMQTERRLTTQLTKLQSQILQQLCFQVLLVISMQSAMFLSVH